MAEPPKSRDELLRTPIAELAAYWVGVRCGDRCNRSTYMPLKLMAARHGGRLSLHAVLERLRCQCCKTPPAEAWLTDHPISDGSYGGVAATWSIVLVS